MGAAALLWTRRPQWSGGLRQEVCVAATRLRSNGRAPGGPVRVTHPADSDAAVHSRDRRYSGFGGGGGGGFGGGGCGGGGGGGAAARMVMGPVPTVVWTSTGWLPGTASRVVVERAVIFVPAEVAPGAVEIGANFVGPDLYVICK